MSNRYNDNDYMYYEEEETEKKSGYKVITRIVLLIHIIAVVISVGYLAFVNILPLKYLLGVGGVLLIGWAIQYFCLYRCKTLKGAKYTFSNFLSICAVTISVMVFIYFGGAVSLMNTISNVQEYDIYSLRVLQTSSITDVSQVKGKTIGNSAVVTEDDLNKCMSDLTNKLSGKPTMKEYDDDDALTNALLDKKVEVILFDEALLSSIEENNEGFSEKTRVVYEIKIATEKASSNSKRSNINVTKDPFNILITGMDSSGKIASRGNSDVNILATVNPKTKKILLTTTPRDFYVPLEGNQNKYDKLTHAGNYGAECSMSTISALYNTPIDYYVKVNFTSVQDLVDALGGVTVVSDATFNAPLLKGGTTKIVKGTNNLNGAEALAFSRERKSLSGGDRARGKHQQVVISAIIDKITSSAMVTRYNSVINAIEKNTVTDLSSDEMTSLIKQQISNPSGWKTESISVDGTGDSRYTYSYKKRKLYVMVPDQSTVTAAKNKIAEYMK